MTRIDAPASSQSPRYPQLDVARGIAVLAMVLCKPFALILGWVDRRYGMPALVDKLFGAIIFAIVWVYFTTLFAVDDWMSGTREELPSPQLA